MTKNPAKGAHLRKPIGTITYRACKGGKKVPFIKTENGWERMGTRPKRAKNDKGGIFKTEKKTEKRMKQRTLDLSGKWKVYIPEIRAIVYASPDVTDEVIRAKYLKNRKVA